MAVIWEEGSEPNEEECLRRVFEILLADIQVVFDELDLTTQDEIAATSQADPANRNSSPI